jgi:hypothetical protein
MPVLTAGRTRPRSTTRRRPGGRAAWLLAGIAAVSTGACIADEVRPSNAPSPGATAAGSGAASATAPLEIAGASPPAAGPGGSPAGSPGPLPDLTPITPRIDAITVICEAWGSEPPPSTIDCGDAVSLGLAAIGAEGAASVRRLDFRFAAPCGAATCAGRRPDAGWVLARSESFDTLVVPVAIDLDGVLRAWPPIDGPVQPDPPFRPPARLAPDLGPSGPAELRDRVALPFCGEETMRDPDAFDRAARTCFLDGVLAGSPVELVSRAWSTEGHPITTVYRYPGRGAVLRYLGTDRWVVSACGVEPIDTPAVFLMAGICQRREL